MHASTQDNPPGDPSAPTTAHYRPTIWEMIPSAVYVVVWLLPIAYVGSSHGPVPYVGDFLNNNYRVACLFTNRARTWRNIYFQVQHEGTIGWIDVPESDYSPMNIFGYYSRLYLLLSQADWQPHGMLERQRIAEFIKARYEQLHPDAPRVVSVRFVNVVYQTGEDCMARPDGAWERPPLDQVPYDRRRVISEHYFDGRIPRDGQGKEVWLKPRRGYHS